MLKGFKERFLSFEIEIEKKMNMVDVKDVLPAEISILQDGHILVAGDTAGSGTTAPLTNTADDVHTKEEKQSTQDNYSHHDESSS